MHGTAMYHIQTQLITSQSHVVCVVCVCVCVSTTLHAPSQPVKETKWQSSSSCVVSGLVSSYAGDTCRMGM